MGRFYTLAMIFAVMSLCCSAAWKVENILHDIEDIDTNVQTQKIVMPGVSPQTVIRFY